MAVAVEQLLTSGIERPARYLGNELGAVRKSWETAAIRWVLTYPEVYEVGASNLGHMILYSILNAQPRQLCDRAYLPATDLAKKLRQTDTPLFAVEAQRPLLDFDILGFSLSYELGATNILEMLDLAGIPLTWQERASFSPWAVQSNSVMAPAYPLIFAGGQTATSNPEPYADFFDFIALGDGEELLPEIGLVLEEGKNAKLSREALLLDLAQVPGVYVPQFYDMAADGSIHPSRSDVPARILRRVADPLPAYSIGLVPYIQTVHDRLTLEIRRGCTRGCRFCQPGMLTRPARDVEPEQVVQTIEQGMRQTGYNEFSLLSLSCSDYLALPAVGIELKNRLKDNNISLSLPSQRVDRFDDNIANIIGGTRQTGITFAPEAGTQRMRDIINKGLSDEELLRGVKTARDRGWNKIKLYFMIGLPGETDADVLGIAETVRWLQKECFDPNKKRLNFNITLSNFTPKPHTPFQWHSVSTAAFQHKQALLKSAFRPLKGVKANFTDVRISAMEDFVGRGDRRLAAVVQRAWELGAGMDSWWESLDRAFQAWTQAIDESGLSWKYRQIEKGEWDLSASDANNPTSIDLQTLDKPLPWDYLDTGIEKAWLKEDLKRALATLTVPDCSFEGCSHCGVCGPDFGHNEVFQPPPIPQFTGHFQVNRDRLQRLRVWFGKQGRLALISHLDLMRLFDRAVRRANLPLAFTGGFHPGPCISPANALSLGATSSGEIADFALTAPIEPGTFQARLAAQLPAEIPVYRVETIALDAPAATRLLEKAEYFITVSISSNPSLHQGKQDVGLTQIVAHNTGELRSRSTNRNQSSYPPEMPAPSIQEWQQWIATLLASDKIWLTQTTKSGKSKQIEARERLFELEIVLAPFPDCLPTTAQPKTKFQQLLRYVGSCKNDGTLLRPKQTIEMLEQISQQSLKLLNTHRTQLFLKSPI